MHTALPPRHVPSRRPADTRSGGSTRQVRSYPGRTPKDTWTKERSAREVRVDRTSTQEFPGGKTGPGRKHPERPRHFRGGRRSNASGDRRDLPPWTRGPGRGTSGTGPPGETGEVGETEETGETGPRQDPERSLPPDNRRGPTRTSWGLHLRRTPEWTYHRLRKTSSSETQTDCLHK